MHPTMSPVIAEQRRADIRRAADRQAFVHAASRRQPLTRRQDRVGFSPVAALFSQLHALVTHVHGSRPTALTRP